MQILHEYWPSTFTSKLNTASGSDCSHSNTQLLMERNETYVVLEKKKQVKYSVNGTCCNHLRLFKRNTAVK